MVQGQARGQGATVNKGHDHIYKIFCLSIAQNGHNMLLTQLVNSLCFTHKASLEGGVIIIHRRQGGFKDFDGDLGVWIVKALSEQDDAHTASSEHAHQLVPLNGSTEQSFSTLQHESIPSYLVTYIITSIPFETKPCSYPMVFILSRFTHAEFEAAGVSIFQNNGLLENVCVFLFLVLQWWCSGIVRKVSYILRE